MGYKWIANILPPTELNNKEIGEIRVLMLINQCIICKRFIKNNFKLGYGAFLDLPFLDDKCGLKHWVKVDRIDYESKRSKGFLNFLLGNKDVEETLNLTLKNFKGRRRIKIRFKIYRYNYQQVNLVGERIG